MLLIAVDLLSDIEKIKSTIFFPALVSEPVTTGREEEPIPQSQASPSISLEIFTH